MTHLALPLLRLCGGLTLFLVGMRLMTQSLNTAAGKRLRQLLNKAGDHKWTAVATGTLIGTLIQSSAGSVMLIGFISAGLITFAGSIAVILGINVGTTLSMLLISFRLGDACWLAILAGTLIHTLAPAPRAKASGIALLGFGIIFLGLNTMSAAIAPFRETLSPLLQVSNGRTLQGMLIGIAAATSFTAIIQSSGATIAMIFAMIAAGAITDIAQAYPLIIGANIGTCATAMLGSIGGPIEARRSALAHLLFNIASAILAVVTAPLLFWAIPHTVAPSLDAAQSLIRQCANANVIKMVISALLALPFTKVMTRIILRITPASATSEPESQLIPALLDSPEDALSQSVQELDRLGMLCGRQLERQAAAIQSPNGVTAHQIQHLEATLDAGKTNMHAYLRQLSKAKLSRRQQILASRLYTGIDHIERIADHLAELAELAHRHRHAIARHLSQDHKATLGDLTQRAAAVVQSLQPVLTSKAKRRPAMIQASLDTRDHYMQLATTTRDHISRDLAANQLRPDIAIYLNMKLSIMSRIVKHVKALVQITADPGFRIKKRKLQNPRKAPDPIPHPE